MTAEAWEAVRGAVTERPWLAYFQVPMARVLDDAELLRPGAVPEGAEEPQNPVPPGRRRELLGGHALWPPARGRAVRPAGHPRAVGWLEARRLGGEAWTPSPEIGLWGAPPAGPRASSWARAGWSATSRAAGRRRSIRSGPPSTPSTSSCCAGPPAPGVSTPSSRTRWRRRWRAGARARLDPAAGRGGRGGGRGRAPARPLFGHSEDRARAERRSPRRLAPGALSVGGHVKAGRPALSQAARPTGAGDNHVRARERPLRSDAPT